MSGSLAIVVLPLLRGPLGFDPAAFGRWAGASVHDVGQTVATANQVPGALTAALVVKLSRVILLAPLVVAVGLVARRRHNNSEAGPARRKTPIVPLFVVGFLASIGLTSTGLLPTDALRTAQHIQGVLLVAALLGLVTGIQYSTLRRTGGRALLLGLTSWLLVAGTALLGVPLLHR